MLHLRSLRGCGVKLHTAPFFKIQNKYVIQHHSTLKKSPLLSNSNSIWSSQILVSSKLNKLNTINAFRNQTVISRLNLLNPHPWQQSRNFWNFWTSGERDALESGASASKMRKVWTRRYTDPEYEHSYYDYKKRRWMKVGLSDYKPWTKYRPKKLLLTLLLLLLGISAIIELDVFNQNKDLDYFIRLARAVFNEPIEIGKQFCFSCLNFVLRWVMWLAPFKHGIWPGFWRNLVVGEEDWIPWDTFMEAPLPTPYGPEFFLVLDPLLFVSVTFHPITGWTVLKRPGTDFFLQQVSKNWEITIYSDDFSTAQDSITARLDPEWDFVSNALYVESCVRRQGEYYKDVTLLKRPLDRLLLLDGKKRSCDFERNTENCLHIPYWDGDPNDTVLLDLLPFLLDISDEAPDEDVDIRTIVEGVKGIDIASYYKPLRLLAKEATDEQVARRRQEDVAIDSILKDFVIDFMKTRKEDAAFDPFMYVEEEDPDELIKEVLPNLTSEYIRTHPMPVFQDEKKAWPNYEGSSYRLDYDPHRDMLPGKSVERRFKHLDMELGKADSDLPDPDPDTPEDVVNATVRNQYFQSRFNHLRQNYTKGEAPSPYGDFMLGENDPIPKTEWLGFPPEKSTVEEEEEEVQAPAKSSKGSKMPRDPKSVTRERTKRLKQRRGQEDDDD